MTGGAREPSRPRRGLPAMRHQYLDLDGMRVRLEDGTEVGVIEAVYDLPQGLVMDVVRTKGSVMIARMRLPVNTPMP